MALPRRSVFLIGALTRLTKVAYEHDEDFEGHLALLLHVVVLALDSEEPLVVGAAQVRARWGPPPAPQPALAPA